MPPASGTTPASRSRARRNVERGGSWEDQVTAGLITESQSKIYSRNPKNGGAALGGDEDTSPSRFLSRMDKDRSDLEKSLGPAPEAPSESSILEEKRKAAQAQADLITAQFNKTLADSRIEGDKRMARTKASTRASGLVGSSFASTMANETAEVNFKDLQLIEQERDAKIAAIMEGVADRASEEYRLRREQYLKENESRFDRIQAFNDKVTDRVVNEVAAIAAAGLTYDDFKAKYPREWKQFLEEGNMTEDGLKARFIANAPKGTIVNQDKPMIANGKATYVVQKIDPKTGLPTFSTVDVALPAGYKEENIKQIISRDDGIYVINNDGTYKILGQSDSDDNGRVPIEGAPSWEEYLKAAEDTARQTLSPEARAELKKQYDAQYTKADVSDFTDTEKRKLEQAGLLNAPRQQQLDHLYGKNDSGSSASSMSDEDFLKYLRGEEE